jgi:dTDP-4-dehydrorhamnose 3,5-epimerase
MRFTKAALTDVLIIEPEIHGDDRGFFMETFRADLFRTQGIELPFVQDNHSRSQRGSLRGLHYQLNFPQGKLLRVVSGEIYDVVVDIRRSSPTFGNWISLVLSSENKKMIWIPPVFAHGFLTLSESAEVIYKTTDYYSPENERSILWSDPEIGIDWPLDRVPEVILSARDRSAPTLSAAEVYP